MQKLFIGDLEICEVAVDGRLVYEEEQEETE